MPDVSNYQNTGVNSVLKVSNDKIGWFTAKAYADVIKRIDKEEQN
jgi:hypothetical protein